MKYVLLCSDLQSRFKITPTRPMITSTGYLDQDRRLSLTTLDDNGQHFSVS